MSDTINFYEREVAKLIRYLRKDTIEDCARVAEDWLTYNSMSAEIAAAIRVLKDKPNG